MAYVPNSGSVVAFQSDPTKLVGTVSVVGTVNVGNQGSVVAFQGTSPWVVSPNNSSMVTISQGSVATVIIGGSIAASFTPPANQSVSGTVGASVVGHAPVVIVGGSIAASFTPPANQSVSGTVGASVIGLTPVAVTNIPSISGTVLVGNFPTNQNVSGSVVAFQGAGWSGSVAAIRTGQSGTVMTSVTGTVSVLGAVPVTQSGTWNPSAIGYVTRNDAVASFLGADLTYRPQASDSAGRTVIKPFAPEEARVEGYISLTSTSVTTLVAAAGAGLRNYITDLWAANTGAATTLLTLTSGGGSSVLGYTIVPAGGGTNLQGLTVPIRTEANATFGVQAATASSTLYVTVKGFKAP